MLEKLQSASYNGATFLIESANTDGGRKTVTHEYPNSNIRYVEDLGDLQETFSITGIITGNNYIADRDALISALKTPGRGQLIHPFYGSIMVTAKPYSLSENLTELGIAKFSMTFEKSDDAIFPTVSSDNTSEINEQTNSLVDLVSNFIGDDFNVTKKYPANFTSAQGIIGNVYNALTITADTSAKVLGELSSFNSLLTTFDDNTNSNINDPTNLAGDFTNLFDSFSQIGRDGKSQFELLLGLFGFGEGDAEIPTTTVQRIERENNRKVINDAVNISALTNAYNTVPQLDFTTEDDIKLVQNTLDTQFEYIMENSIAPDNIIQAIKTQRVSVTKYLENRAVNAFKIASITTQEIPMTLLCYQYYGSVDKTNDLLNLNNTIDSSFVDGNVNILTL